ncbi:peptidase inhibitor family I36 protein [Actinomadura litoris]|uniref:peptidase inhibitor family I36 protein n=1 Tax=Actinomadura litoris TaxID=2678616 RepID=UPI001FA776FB|nr:peptidase inhibitor family I36 protein [Actinomadura litoris]
MSKVQALATALIRAVATGAPTAPPARAIVDGESSPPQKERAGMKLKRTLTVGAVAAACAAGTTVGTTGIANADWRDCPNGSVCVWEHSNYNGRFLSGGTTVGNVGSAINDKTTSLWNRTGTVVCFFEHTNSGGRAVYVTGPGDSSANVGNSANDKISSWGPCN